MLLTTPAARATSNNEPAARFRDCPPANFDASACPIIAQHWFGLGPLRPTGQVTGGVVADLRRQRRIEHLTQLGPRAVGELLYEVADGEDLDRALEAYARLTPELLAALGGDRFPPVPIHEVER